jgi:Zn-dependent peptidase ImmA (M78 family)
MRLHFVRQQAEALAGRNRVAIPPIDVVRAAEELGLHVIAEDLGANVSGLLVNNGSQAYICVQKKDAETRRRFTIAHEIGHFVLGHQFRGGEHVHVDKGNFISQRGPRSSAGIDPMEIEANQFAASLLMPSKLVRQHAVDRGLPLLDSDVSALAKLFKVSEQAMTIRLSSLGLL